MSTDVTCPRCQRNVRIPPTLTDEVVTCPACLATLANPHGVTGTRGRGIEADVRREWSAASVLLAVLIALCVVAIVLVAAFLPDGGSWNLRVPVLLAFGFAVLDVLVILAGLRAMWSWAASGPRAESVGKVLALLLASVGVIVGVVILFVVACAALLEVRG